MAISIAQNVIVLISQTNNHKGLSQVPNSFKGMDNNLKIFINMPYTI